MNAFVRILIAAAALCLAVAAGYVAGVRSAGRDASPAPEQTLTVQAAPAPPPPAPVKAAAPSPPPPPKPKAATVAAQAPEDQIAEDAAAVGMTTVEPADEPASADASAPPAADSAPPY